MAASDAEARAAAAAACNGILHGLVAQAVVGAITAALAVGSARKDTAMWVAAAARGAALGAGAGAGPVEPLSELQGVVYMLGAANVKVAVATLRRHGCMTLAARLQRLSKTRNGIAHPDISLSRDVAAAIAEWVQEEEEVGSKPSVSPLQLGAVSDDGCLPADDLCLEDKGGTDSSCSEGTEGTFAGACQRLCHEAHEGTMRCMDGAAGMGGLSAGASQCVGCAAVGAGTCAGANQYMSEATDLAGIFAGANQCSTATPLQEGGALQESALVDEEVGLGEECTMGRGPELDNMPGKVRANDRLPDQNSGDQYHFSDSGTRSNGCENHSDLDQSPDMSKMLQPHGPASSAEGQRPWERQHPPDGPEAGDCCCASDDLDLRVEARGCSAAGDQRMLVEHEDATDERCRKRAKEIVAAFMAGARTLPPTSHADAAAAKSKGTQRRS